MGYQGGNIGDHAVASDRELQMNDILASLPPELARNRALNTAQSAAYLNLSVPHFRRLYRANKVPAPVRLGERKLAWRAGDLSDFIAQRSSTAD